MKICRAAVKNDTYAQRPKGFSLDEYNESGAMQFGQSEVVKLKANVSETLAMYLDECEIAKDQKLHFVDGKWRLSAKRTKIGEILRDIRCPRRIYQNIRLLGGVSI